MLADVVVSNRQSLLRLCLLMSLLAFPTAGQADGVSKESAMSWAIEHRQQVFDQLMPRAPEFGADLAEITISIRSNGFEDHYEFALTIEQRDGRPLTATVAIPSGEPLVVQLARARQAGASLESAISSVKIDRRAVPAGVAKELFAGLMAATVPLRPQSGLMLHRQRLEITVIGSSDLTLEIFDDGDRRSPYSNLIGRIYRALSSVDINQRTLRFDPKKYYGRR